MATFLEDLRIRQPKKMSAYLEADKQVFQMCHVALDFLEGRDGGKAEDIRCVLEFSRTKKEAIKEVPCLACFFNRFNGEKNVSESKHLGFYIKPIGKGKGRKDMTTEEKRDLVEEYLENIDKNEKILRILLQLIDEMCWEKKWKVREVDTFYRARFERIKCHQTLNRFFLKYNAAGSKEVEEWKKKNET